MDGPFAHLRPENAFSGIFRHGMAPVRSVVPGWKLLEGHAAAVLCYSLDWHRCSLEEQVQVAATAIRLQGGKLQDLVSSMAAGGEMPIRVNETSAICCGVFEFV